MRARTGAGGGRDAEIGANGVRHEGSSAEETGEEGVSTVWDGVLEVSVQRREDMDMRLLSDDVREAGESMVRRLGDDGEWCFRPWPDT